MDIHAQYGVLYVHFPAPFMNPEPWPRVEATDQASQNQTDRFGDYARQFSQLITDDISEIDRQLNLLSASSDLNRFDLLTALDHKRQILTGFARQLTELIATEQPTAATQSRLAIIIDALRLQRAERLDAAAQFNDPLSPAVQEAQAGHHDLAALVLSPHARALWQQNDCSGSADTAAIAGLEIEAACSTYSRSIHDLLSRQRMLDSGTGADAAADSSEGPLDEPAVGPDVIAFPPQ